MPAWSHLRPNSRLGAGPDDRAADLSGRPPLGPQSHLVQSGGSRLPALLVNSLTHIGTFDNLYWRFPSRPVIGLLGDDWIEFRCTISACFYAVTYLLQWCISARKRYCGQRTCVFVSVFWSSNNLLHRILVCGGLRSKMTIKSMIRHIALRLR